MTNVHTALRDVQRYIHRISVERGKWDGEASYDPVFGAIYTALREVRDGLRSGDPTDAEFPDYTVAEVGLARVVIEALDLAAQLGYDLGDAIMMLASARRIAR